MATDDGYEMNSCGEELNNSQQLTEEDLIDSLFVTCDVEKLGRIPVSRLIEYLKFTTSAISENDEDLQNLRTLFNKGGDEAEIDLGTYRNRMTIWIDSIRSRNENESDHDRSLESTSNSSNIRVKVLTVLYKIIFSTNRTDISIVRGSNMDTSIVETFGTEIDTIDQQNKIADLQHQNRKMTEENTKLRQQIDIQEDIVTVNNTEIDKLKKKIRSLQHLADSRLETIAENEELKSNISKLQETKKELTSKISHLDKEKLNYENQCSDLELKLTDLTSQLECILSQRDIMHKELAECKHELSHAKELKSIQEIQLHERYLEVISLQKQLTGLSTELKDCKQEKYEIKLELLQTQQDLVSHLPDESGNANDEMIPPKIAGSFVCSTPMRQSPSLCMELKGMIGHDKYLLSPLCPKEFHKEYRMKLPPVFDEEEEKNIEEDISDYHLEIDTERFKHKQSELLAEIDSYFRQEDNEDKLQTKEKLQTSLQREISEMIEQMASLAIAKATVDKRVNYLNQSVKKVREENAMLRRMQHDSRSMLVESDRDLPNVVDRRILILRDKLDEEKKIVKNLKRELEEKSRALLKLEEIQYEEIIPKLEDEICILKKENMELSKNLTNTEGQISCLQDDMTKSEKDVEIEKHRSFELEQDLYLNKLARQMDLKEIWRIVQKDIENECIDDKFVENGLNDSSDTVKKMIFNEIVALKSQLHVREHKIKQKKRELSLHRCSCVRSSSTASSPLVEALTIDFYNGNRSVPYLHESLPLNKETTSKSRDTLTTQDNIIICTDNTNEENQHLSQNSQSCSTGDILDLECQSGSNTYNNSLVDINENDDSVFSIEDSLNRLRRLSYQAAIDNNEVIHKDSIGQDFVRDKKVDQLDSKTNTKAQTQSIDRPETNEVNLRNSVTDDDKQTGDSGGTALEDYCWNDSMVVFDDDISYSSYSFSHLSYPFQPLRQDIVRADSTENEEERELKSDEQKSCDCNVLSAEDEGKVDAEITQLSVCLSSEGSNSMSITSALGCKLEKLTLEDSLEQKKADGDGLPLKEESKMEQPELKSTNPQLSKIRQNNLARRREQMKHISIMPDLKESKESSWSNEETGQEAEPSKKVPEENGESHQDKDKVVFPSIPDSFLKKHGLAYKKKENVTSSIHQLTESEVENKFTSLSLAFKTDKLTLEKRLEIQERYRDLSEQNVEKEIKGLRSSVETVCHLPECVDSQVQDVLKKIRRHIDVLEQGSTKVSSRAEVFGAVQQEKRMSKAIEVMIAHVENLKMAYEREHAELEDARKLIQDGRPFGTTFDSESGFASRRSASVCQGMGLGQKTSRRRVSESTGPRIGSNGTLAHSISLDISHPLDSRYGLRRDPMEDEDAKSKFQSAIASTVIKNTVTNTLRTKSTDQLSLSSREPSMEGEKTLLSKQNSKEEEAFQKGFEQGYKTQVGRDLSQLREQQNNVSQTLENIMDEYDKDNEQEEKNLTETIKEKFWETVPTWDTASKKLRMTMAGFVFFMALCSIVLSLFPVGQAAMQVQPQYRNIGQPPS